MAFLDLSVSANFAVVALGRLCQRCYGTPELGVLKVGCQVVVVTAMFVMLVERKEEQERFCAGRFQSLRMSEGVA